MRHLDAHCIDTAHPHADAVAFLERWPDREQADPGEHNMLWHAEWQAAGGAAGPPPGPPAAVTAPQPEVEVPDAEAVVEAAAAFADWPVLFLGAVPKLGSADTLAPVEEAHKRCHLFGDGPQGFEPSGTAGDNRLAWLNGTL